MSVGADGNCTELTDLPQRSMTSFVVSFISQAHNYRLKTEITSRGVFIIIARSLFPELYHSSSYLISNYSYIYIRATTKRLTKKN